MVKLHKQLQYEEGDLDKDKQARKKNVTTANKQSNQVKKKKGRVVHSTRTPVID